MGDVKFGMNPQEVRCIIGADFKSFERTPQTAFPSDYYEALGLFFYYDPTGVLEAIEFATPAKPNVCGIELIGRELIELVSELSPLDQDIGTDVDGAIANGIGVSVWAPLAEDDGRRRVTSALAFRKGYYD